MLKKIISAALAVVLICGLFGCKSAEDKKTDYSTVYQEPEGGFEQLQMPSEGEEIAVITTNYGVIKARFFPEYAPLAVENFITHAKNGYYDGLIFHRVIDGFMIQGGDPQGTGMGGESIWGDPFGIETTPQLHHIRGALAMAKSSAPVSIGSQFYIVQNKLLEDLEPEESKGNLRQEFEYYLDNIDRVVDTDNDGNDLTIGMYFQKPFIESYLSNGGTPSLDFSYTVFGQAFEGLDIVDAIATTEVNSSDKPLEDVIIESIVIETYTP